jgi:hypothetical protein
MSARTFPIMKLHRGRPVCQWQCYRLRDGRVAWLEHMAADDRVHVIVGWSTLAIAPSVRRAIAFLKAVERST